MFGSNFTLSFGGGGGGDAGRGGGEGSRGGGAGFSGTGSGSLGSGGGDGGGDGGSSGSGVSSTSAATSFSSFSSSSPFSFFSAAFLSATFYIYRALPFASASSCAGVRTWLPVLSSGGTYKCFGFVISLLGVKKKYEIETQVLPKRGKTCVRNFYDGKIHSL